MFRLFKDIKYKIQRARKKYSNDMCWDLQYTLLEILPKMIETLRQGKHSYPELEFEEIDSLPHDWVQNALKELEKERNLEDYDKPDIKDQFTRWHLILKRISYCLMQADETQTEIKNKYQREYDKQLWGIEDWEEDKKLSVKEWFKKHTYVSKRDENGKPVLHTFDFKEVDPELKKNYFDESRRIDEYRDNMKTEAFNLINKYFWHLWD